MYQALAEGQNSQHPKQTHEDKRNLLASLETTVCYNKNTAFQLYTRAVEPSMILITLIVLMHHPRTPNLALVDLASFYLGHFKNPGLID